MAQDQKKTPAGGNKPKPAPTGANKPKPAPTGAKAGQSAKDRSRAQSRPVTGKAPTGKSGKATGANKNGSGGGNKPRPGSRPAPAPAPRRISGTMMAWGAVGLVVVIIVVLVIVKTTSTTSNAYTPVTPAPAAVVHDVTNIPLSVYNTVGVSSPTVPVNPPTIVKGQPPLTFDGKTPGLLFYGAEYCPFCAAERWSLTAALSRFGTWSGLKITASSHTDTDPETHTFSYHGATFTSPYLAVKTVEAVSNVPNGNGYYNALETPTKSELADVSKYEGPTYFPGSNGQIGFPFISINNHALISGPSYDPGVLAGQSWSSIASGLSDPSNPTTQAIVATANYMTASICANTQNAPASVCTSKGVEAAAKALKLS
jgi:hypothetical protein